MTLAYVNGRIIDGISDRPLDGHAIVIQDDHIKAIVPMGSLPDDIKRVDCSGLTIMPGLVDVHVHFAHMYTGYLIYHQDVRLGYIQAKTLWAMERMLASGVTSARDLGGLDAGFVDAEEEGFIRAPRLAGNAVQFMMPTNGSFDALPGLGGYTSAQGYSVDMPGFPPPHCDGPWECRKRTREVLRAGAEVIKIGSGGCLAMRRYNHQAPTFTREELDVFVDEGMRQRMAVHCHCFGGPGLDAAIDAGVTCIEHGAGMTEQLLHKMAEKQIWWVPTFWVTWIHTQIDPSQEERDEMQRYLDNLFQMVERAVSIGVPIALGSDGGLHDADNNASQKEVEFLAQAGMSNREAIHTATRMGAKLLGTDNKIGTIAEGKLADLLFLDGDVLSDVGLLQRDECRKLVLKGGEPVGGAWTKGSVLEAHS